MAPRDTALLCLVLCLAHGAQALLLVLAQEGDLPAPSISTVPRPLVPQNASLRILCRGTPEAFLYQLLLLRNSTFVVVHKQLGFAERAEFILGSMDTSTAGQYWCQYRQRHHWSKRSEALRVVVTGWYNKPFLSMDQSPVVIRGENVSFHCHSGHTPFDRFALAKEGDTSLPQHQQEGLQGSFTLGPVNSSSAGKYICYGWYSSSPQVWSAPSDALELVIAGVETTSPSLNHSEPKTAPHTQDYTVGNLLRMVLAGLVLVVLRILLFEARHNQRRLAVPPGSDDSYCSERWSPGNKPTVSEGSGR